MALPASGAHAAAGMAAQLAAGDADAWGLLRRSRPRTMTAPAGVHAQIPGFAVPRTVLLPSLISAAASGPRALTDWRCVGAGQIDGSAGRSTVAVSITNKSSGVHCKAVHDAISVVILIWWVLGEQRRHRRRRHLQPDFVCQQPAQLGPGPYFACAAAIRSRRLILTLARLLRLSSTRVVFTARRYASSMKVVLWPDIPHRRFDGPVPPNLLDRNQIHATLIVVGRSRTSQRVRTEPLRTRAPFELHQISQPVTDRSTMQRPAGLVDEQHRRVRNLGRTSARNQRSRPSSIGIHRGRGPDILAPLPKRT